MAAPLTDSAIRWEGRGVRAVDVAKRMLEIRTGAADDEGYPLTRASVMNLLVYVESADQLQQAVAAVDDLALRHPSRAIVIAPARGTRFSLDAEVVLHRHPLGSHGVVFERALLRPKGISPEGLDTLVIPLLIPHLQSVLWWVGDPDTSNPALRSLMSICDRVIVDSSLGPCDRLGALSAGVVAPAPLRLEAASRRPVLGDTAWSRLEPFRETMARAFDEGHRTRYLDGIQRLVVVGPRTRKDQPGSGEHLFAGWFTTRLGYAHPIQNAEGVSLQIDRTGRRTTFEFLASGRRAGVPAQLGLAGFKLEAAAGSRHIVISLGTRGGRWHLDIDESGSEPVRRPVPLWEPTETQVLSRELTRMGRDRVYEDSLQAAARIFSVLQ